ncbi:MAG: ATP-binding cassette domain-containing protein [Thermoanaerobaculia bacterium]
MSVAFRGVRLPLAGFDLRVDGELGKGWTGVVGPSGAGKTSLLELVAGFRDPSEGTIAIRGRVVVDASARTRISSRSRGVGYVTQDETLFPHLSARGNLLYGAGRAGPSSPGLERVVSLLALEPLLDRAVTNLSGGEKRRVALARAILSGPDLLLLDEPLTGLDSPLRDQVMGSLKAIHSQFPVPAIFVAHNPEEVATLCDEVIVLSRGAVRFRGDPGEVLAPSSREIFRNGGESS